MVDVGLSYDQVASLPQYWKLLLLGYREKKKVNHQEEMAKLQSRMRKSQSGWMSLK